MRRRGRRRLRARPEHEHADAEQQHALLRSVLLLGELQRGKLDQAEQFPLCQPGPLQALFEKSGLKAVETRAIEIPTVFQTFDDYWKPFLGRTGAAPSCCSRS